MDENDKFERLCQILTADGVQGLDFCCLEEFKNTGRGLCSLLSRQPGETLFRIPRKYILSDYNIAHHAKLSAIWEAYPQILCELQRDSRSDNAIYPFLLLFFLELVSPSSEFNRIWFSMFPRDLRGHTIAWTDKELKSCGNLCPIRRDTIQVQVWIKKTYRTLQPIVQQFESIFGAEGASLFTESMVEFLCMTCRNRGVLLPIAANTAERKTEHKEAAVDKDTTLYHCFVPLGDFGNHKFGAKSSFQLEQIKKRRHMAQDSVNLFVKTHPDLMAKKFFEYEASDNCLVVRAQEPILSGGQICYEYTAAPNWELLQNFGFAVPFNPFDKVIVNVTFDSEDPKRLSRELRILDQLGVAQFVQRLPSSGGKDKRYLLAVALTLRDACPQILLSANRIKLLSDEQLDQLSVQHIAFMDKVIAKNKESADVNKLKILELKVLRSLQASVDVLYSGYQKESLIEDLDVKHDDVNVVYQSIRRILAKAKQRLEQSIHVLGS